MISALDVGYQDVCARSLGWALDLPARPALASTTCGPDNGTSIELRLLGASHQVLVRRGRTLLCSETVACDLPDSEPLPPTMRSGSYEFRSGVRRLAPEELAAEIDRIGAALEPRADALVGHFPGTPYATTALAVDLLDAGRVAWQTWHGYPQTGELVTTRTTLTLEEVSR